MSIDMTQIENFPLNIFQVRKLDKSKIEALQNLFPIYIQDKQGCKLNFSFPHKKFSQVLWENEKFINRNYLNKK